METYEQDESLKGRRVRTELSIPDMPRTARHTRMKPFFWLVYLTLALNSPVKIYSLIHANKKIYLLNIAKYTIEITKSQ